MNQLSAHQENGSERVLNIVIKSLKSIFPAWKTAIQSQSDLDGLKKEWLIAFIENNIKTDRQINKGLSEARLSKSPFFPSCGEFVNWCKIPTKIEFYALTDQLDNSVPSSREYIQEILKRAKL